MSDDIEGLIQRLADGDDSAGDDVLVRAWTDSTPRLLVAAALLVEEPAGLLARATRHATATRDRQLVAIAAAHVEGDQDRLDALVLDHLADHPDSTLALWIALQHRRFTPPDPHRTTTKETVR